MKIWASEQVQAWLRGLPPQTRAAVRAALRSLERGRAGEVDAVPLRRELEGFHRLRVGDYRIIYSHQPGPVLRLEFADIRETVYETFRALRALREG